MMLVPDNDHYRSLIDDLEQQERQAPNAVPSADVYGQLLTLYLLENDLFGLIKNINFFIPKAISCNAKYLWNRIPEPVKTENPELQNIWNIAQKLWVREFKGVYQTITSAQWSPNVSQLVNRLLEKTRQRAILLVSNAYSFITLTEFCSIVGLDEREALALAATKEWTYDSNLKLVTPKKPEPQAASASSDAGNDDQLKRLTDFVAFLEN